MDEIVKQTEAHFGLLDGELMSNSRFAYITEPRMLAALVAFMRGYKTGEIAAHFGREKAKVDTALIRIEQKIKDDEQWHEHLQNLLARVPVK